MGLKDENRMTYYPVFLQLEGKIALVVGGGKVAQRKVETLLRYGASIHIISKVLTDKLKQLIDIREVRFLGEEMRDDFLDEAFIVVAATDDKKLNSKVSESARKRGLLVNAVDQPADCNFIVPSIVKKGDLSIAISTSGKSPALAKKIRKELDGQFGNEYEIFLNLMGGLRKEILGMGFSQEENSRIFHEIVNGGIIEAIARNDLAKVESSLARILPQEINIKEVLSELK
jgi:precorrin-2 dehydrogenase/sirohydrochlorin ferrochelatase